MLDTSLHADTTATTAFQVGPYRCVALAQPCGPARPHVGIALIRREEPDGTRETRLTFDEEEFDTAEEAVAYAAARADYLLRFEADSVVPF